MPYKNYEDRLAQQRRFYAANREKVIGWVRERKRTKYTGTCEHCGGPTFGDRPKRIPRFCSKPECASVHRKLSHLSKKTGEPY